MKPQEDTNRKNDKVLSLYAWNTKRKFNLLGFKNVR